MIEHSADITKIGAALVTAQGMMAGAKRDAKNPHFKSSYATLETVIETAKPALQSVGVAFMQAPGQLIEGALEVTTMLLHAESGQWVRSTLHVPLPKRDPQGVGSAITYACRYSLMAMLGLPPTDDDGHAAVNSTAPQPDTARVSVAEMKRGLKSIDDDLLDCLSIADVDKCAKAWASIMSRDEWTKDYRDIAAPKFQQRRNAIKEAEGAFPGDMPAPITDAVRNVMAG